ncbi:hypothetical protein D3C72_771800 [compost metagenome]
MDFDLKRLQVVDIAFLFRLEGIKDDLVLAGRIDTALHAELLQHFRKTETTGNDTDRTDDGGGIGDDLVAGKRDHVTAGGCNVLHEDQDLLFLLLGKLADAVIDHPCLHRRTAGRVERNGDGRRILDGEGLLQKGGVGGEIERGAELVAAGHDRAMHAHHRDDELFFTKAFRHQILQKTHYSILAAFIRSSRMYVSPRKTQWFAAGGTAIFMAPAGLPLHYANRRRGHCSAHPRRG